MSTIALFVAHLHGVKMLHKTISTYLSSIAYVHKMFDLPNPTNQFLITLLLRGSQSLNQSYDLRLPITIQILDKLLASLQHVTQTYFHRLLFSAMFLFAFNTFARIGEIALTSRDCLRNLVSIEDIQIIYTDETPCRVSVTFRNFKHSKGKPHVLEFDKGETKVSSIDSLMDYLKVCGKQPGPLFILNNGHIVSRSLFDTQLKKCLLFCGFDSSRYKSHSFRIGKASYCTSKGYSDAYICSVGRWHSTAFRKYIRL